MDPFNPVFALWFLLTLFCFHVILVIVRRYKAYYVLPVALIISILAGFSDDIDGYMSISRTIVFFRFLCWLFNNASAYSIIEK